ncbi:hypothetical protein KFK09_014679 [Dendrobium nobile]|uniref:TF-B3 domain-containing protein n=1 Tax=Dendrobium nobile TaxID=94219 RepID=A0A8T3B3T8_DENNO|nr:hypothetical protein KFK09_014679 [Dendrobium nobile]
MVDHVPDRANQWYTHRSAVLNLQNEEQLRDVQEQVTALNRTPQPEEVEEEEVKEVVLPKKFIDHFKGELLETIELKVPSGDKWNVELKKTGDGVVLDCGWTNFVAAYGILENDTLVFKYDGCSSFIVLMFEQSGCEKDASHCAMRKDGMEELCAIAYGKKDGQFSYESSPITYAQPKQLAMFQKILRENRDAKEKHLKRRMNTTSTKRILRQKKHFTGTRGKKSLNEELSVSSGGPEEVWASGGGPVEVRTSCGGLVEHRALSGSPVEQQCQAVVRRSNDVRLWSDGDEGLKWWSGGATTSGGGPVEMRASSCGPTEQRRQAVVRWR